MTGTKPARAWLRALEAVSLLQRSPTATLASLLDGMAEDYGDRVALLGPDTQLSFRQLASRANRTARWADKAGLAQQTVCLLMRNRPEFVATWLGLTRAGCVVALINTTLVGDGLTHSLRAAGSEHVIVDDDLLGRAGGLSGEGRLWPFSALESALERYGAGPIPAEERPWPDPADAALLIYTSGTTGLPKAAKVSHARILEWSLWFAGMMDVTPEDRLYDCLPLYHSTGGVVAIGAMLVRGGSVMIRQGFSASTFWDDVADQDCTILMYIGELCRYLTQAPPQRKERSHRLRLACGNGLHGSVWESFRTRFAIPAILEFYAATEGNVSLYNCEGKPGAVGRVPPFLAQRFPVALIAVDPETGVPLRDSAGFCRRCGPDQPGEAIGRVDGDSFAPARRFDGYTDPEASAQKLITDVFAAGDCWFRTGDLMRRDTAGFYYFLDRLGDTFRWKGENVSGTEVASVIRSCPGVMDALVYGVRVPGQEGRAGMAAVAADDGFSPAALLQHVSERLPSYAQPLFLRRCDALDLTGTFKLSPARLAREGYAGLEDPVWFLDRQRGYVPCTPDVLASIGDGTTRT